MAEISQIKVPSGTVYDIKDAQARNDISNLQTTVTGAMHYIGITTTALTDGSTTATVSIDGTNKTMTSSTAGAVVIYSEKEYVWNGSKWQEFGSTGSLKALAFKDSASGTVTPTGTVSSTFTGSSSNVTITATDNASGNYQPAGTVSVSTNATTNKTATVSSTSGTATYTPSGSIVADANGYAPAFTGTAATINSTGTFTPAGSVSFTNSNQTATVSPASSGTATYTPEGSVSAPTISVATAGSTTTIHNPTKATVAKTVVAVAPGSTAPSNNLTYYSVSGEVLSLYQLGYTTGDSITTSDVTVKNGDAAYQASTPTFTGTGKRLVTGNISVPSSASFSGTEGNVAVSANYTPAGTNDKFKFSGTGARLVTGNIAVPSSYTASFTGTKVQLDGTTTANGSVSSTFSGDEKTVTVS